MVLKWSCYGAVPQIVRMNSTGFQRKPPIEKKIFLLLTTEHEVELLVHNRVAMCPLTVDQLTQLVPEETFKVWKSIQHEGSINMLEAGAKYPDLFPPEVVSAILDNYSTLDAHYTDKEDPPRGSHDVVGKPSASSLSGLITLAEGVGMPLPIMLKLLQAWTSPEITTRPLGSGFVERGVFVTLKGKYWITEVKFNVQENVRTDTLEHKNADLKAITDKTADITRQLTRQIEFQKALEAHFRP